ncbi:hypothetical protein [Roseobacter sp. GAI101]|uniref:hypothetical protein n=1 Tax=Roseobacter sp. (strain GAI101) TaxID=391589 RepID=UPI0001871B02|nr:hypothetical protein [Roseobacter sp. GAI101]EEB85446.1 hypothetical protein RGAI101_2599 [Roseobacter sp. GAI101]
MTRFFYDALSYTLFFIGLNFILFGTGAFSEGLFTPDILLYLLSLFITGAVYSVWRKYLLRITLRFNFWLMRFLCDGIGYLAWWFLLGGVNALLFPDAAFSILDYLEVFDLMDHLKTVAIGIVLGFWIDIFFRLTKVLKS